MGYPSYPLVCRSMYQSYPDLHYLLISWIWVTFVNIFSVCSTRDKRRRNERNVKVQVGNHKKNTSPKPHQKPRTHAHHSNKVFLFHQYLTFSRSKYIQRTVLLAVKIYSMSMLNSFHCIKRCSASCSTSRIFASLGTVYIHLVVSC